MGKLMSVGLSALYAAFRGGVAGDGVAAADGRGDGRGVSGGCRWRLVNALFLRADHRNSCVSTCSARPRPGDGQHDWACWVGCGRGLPASGHGYFTPGPRRGWWYFTSVSPLLTHLGWERRRVFCLAGAVLDFAGEFRIWFAWSMLVVGEFENCREAGRTNRRATKTAWPLTRNRRERIRYPAVASATFAPRQKLAG